MNKQTESTRAPSAPSAGVDEVARDAHSHESMIKILMDYRCARTVDEDGEGLPLVDVLTPGEGGSIQPGCDEIEYLADYILAELSAIQSAAQEKTP